MAENARRLDQIEKVVADDNRRIDDVATTLLSRMSSHTHVDPRLPYVVTATSSIAAPYNGQIIFNTADNMLYRYDSGTAAWIGFLATGGDTAATRHEARYEQTVQQSVPNTTDTKLYFNNAITTCNDVTASGTNNTDFLLNRAGVWRCSAGMRLTATSAGDRHLFMFTGTSATTLSARFVGATDSDDVGSIAPSLSVSTDIRVAASTTVCAGFWQGSGGSRNTDSAVFPKECHIALTWLRPL